MVGPRLDQILNLEIANEDNFPGSNDDMARVARRIRSALPSVVLAPCALDLETTAQWCAPDKCNEQNLHQERQPGDLNWRQARQLWDTGHWPIPCAALEPMGVDLLPRARTSTIRYGSPSVGPSGCCKDSKRGYCIPGPGVRTGGQYDREHGPRVELLRHRCRPGAVRRDAAHDAIDRAARGRELGENVAARPRAVAG